MSEKIGMLVERYAMSGMLDTVQLPPAIRLSLYKHQMTMSITMKLKEAKQLVEHIESVIDRIEKELSNDN